MKSKFIICTILLLNNTIIYASEKINCPSTEEIKNDLKATFTADDGPDPYHKFINVYLRTNLKVAGYEASSLVRLSTGREKGYSNENRPIADYIHVQFMKDAPLAVSENVLNAALLTCRYKFDYSGTWPSFNQSEVWYASKIDYSQSYLNLLIKIDKSHCSVSGKSSFDCEKAN